MRELRLAALLPALAMCGLLLLGTASSTPAADDGPVVQMTVSPSR